MGHVSAVAREMECGVTYSAEERAVGREGGGLSSPLAGYALGSSLPSQDQSVSTQDIYKHTHRSDQYASPLKIERVSSTYS